MYLTNILGSSAHKFYGGLGSRGGVAKMFENMFFGKWWYGEKKVNEKHQKFFAKFVS